jgi:hypothetical protein
MQRDHLPLGEMIHAAERAHQLTNGLTLEQLQAEHLRSESLLRRSSSHVGSILRSGRTASAPPREFPGSEVP